MSAPSDATTGAATPTTAATPSPTEVLQSLMPLCATLGIREVSARPDEVVLAVDFDPKLCTSNELLHGGTLMVLADSAGAYAAVLNLPEGALGTSTIESKTNFIRGVTGGTVTATSTLLHKGGTTIVIETEMRDSDGRLAAKTTQTQAVLRPR
jgi:uncharacterized protein (TIGR00369 family)